MFGGLAKDFEDLVGAFRSSDDPGTLLGELRTHMALAGRNLLKGIGDGSLSGPQNPPPWLRGSMQGMRGQRFPEITSPRGSGHSSHPPNRFSQTVGSMCVIQSHFEDGVGSGVHADDPTAFRRRHVFLEAVAEWLPIEFPEQLSRITLPLWTLHDENGDELELVSDWLSATFGPDVRSVGLDLARAAVTACGVLTVATESGESRTDKEVGRKINSFVPEGDNWRALFRGTPTSLKHRDGFFYLTYLLSRRGEKVHAGDLLEANPKHRTKTWGGDAAEALEMGLELGAGSDHKLLDEEGRSAYRNAIDELQSNRDETDDPVRKAEFQREIEAVLEHVGQSSYRGKSKSFADKQTKARNRVCAAIRRCISNISDHPALRQHLDSSIKTGKYCSYEPEEETTWVVRPQ